MRKALITTVALLTLTTMIATPASAHAWVFTVEGVDGTTYVKNDGTVWKETNDLTSGGVQSYGLTPGDTGLQMHNVCAGIHTAEEIAIWNWHDSHGHFGSEDGSDTSNNNLNYIPFEGSVGDCEKLGGIFHHADEQVSGHEH